MKEIRCRIVVLICAGICACVPWVHGETVVWQAVTNSLTPGWKTAANWVGGSVPALNGGYDVDLTAPSVVVANSSPLKSWENQIVERVQIPFEETAFGTVAGNWRWLEFDDNASGASCSIANPNGFYGLWAMNRWWILTLGATESFTPVLHRYSEKGATYINVANAGTAAVISNVVDVGMVGKTGDGKLVVAGPGGNKSGIHVIGGTVEVHGAKRYTKSEMDALLAKAHFHVDASQTNTLRFGSDGRVDRWYDVRGTTGYPFGYTLNQNNHILPGPSVAKAYQNGLDVLDFGPKGANFDAATSSWQNCSLRWDDSTYFNRGDYILEAFVVEAPHDDGFNSSCLFGCINDKGFRRDGTGSIVQWSTGVQSVALDTPNVNVRDGDFGINGVKVLPTAMVTSSVMKVYSFRAHEAGRTRINSWGSDYGGNPGGVRVAEAVYYTNFLSHVERKNVIRYLQKKWGCFDDGGEDAYDLGYLHDGTGNATVDVAAGEGLSVREITLAGTSFEKTGGGDLEVGAIRDACGTNVTDITVSGGSLTFGPLIAPSDNPAPAPGSYRHYDASDIDSFTYTEDAAGKLNVSEWRDQSGDAAKTATRLAVTPVTGKTQLGYPRIVENAVNGKSALDFGRAASYNADGVTNCGVMVFDAGATTVGTHSRIRTAFIVMRRTYVNAAWMLGSASVNGGVKYCWFYPGPSTSLFRDVYTGADVLGGEITLNGHRIWWGDTTITEWQDFHVLRISCLGNIFANAFGIDRGGEDYGTMGGFMFGEVLLYSRPLSRQETIDTEAYLMKKWLGKEHPNSVAQNVASYSIGEGAEAAIDTPSDMDVGMLSVASDSFVKSGEGALSVGGMSPSVRNLSVEGGSLSLRIPSGLSAPVFFFDAMAEDSFSTFATDNGNGTVRTNISTWADARANGVSASAYIAYAAVTNPALVTVETRSGVMRPAVDFGRYRSGIADTDDGTTSAFLMNRRFTGVKEVFTVHADKQKDGGPFLFCDSNGYAYHRESARLLSLKNSAIAKDPDLIVKVNNEDGSYSTALSASTFYVVNFSSATNAEISQMSMDRRNNSYRCGGMYCCSQLAFTNQLSAAYRDFVNRTLVYRWFAEGEKPTYHISSLGSVSIAAGSVLSLEAVEDDLLAGDYVFTLDSLSGAGRLVPDCDVSFSDGATWNVGLCENVADTVQIEGGVRAQGTVSMNVTVPDGMTILAETAYPVARIGSLGFDLSQVSLSFSRPLRFSRSSLRCEGGVLYVFFTPKGMALSFR